MTAAKLLTKKPTTTTTTTKKDNNTTNTTSIIKKKNFTISKKLRNTVLTTYKTEKKFISDLFKSLPESAQSKFSDLNSAEDAYIIDSDEELSKNTSGKRKISKKEQFQQRQSQAQSSRTINLDELKNRLHAKIAELGKERLEGQHSEKAIRRKKRKAKKVEENEAKKKQFISQSNPNNPQNKKSGVTNKTTTTLLSGGDASVKTPLQKKPVKTTNGDIVYSKFDFISDGRSTTNKKESNESSTTTTNNKPLSILKSVEKQENKIKKLEGQGKASEAVSALEKQKWNNALQRAKGTKVRDDPTLLKKTIKKMDKMKKVKQKQWTERVDQVEKQKKQRQDKRTANIKARKDEKVKRTKKLQRKKGRIL